jgi:hypothetical protein
LDAGAALPARINDALQSEVKEAAERALAISFGAFQAQVVAFLPPEWQEYYGKKAATWERLQVEVADALTKGTK